MKGMTSEFWVIIAGMVIMAVLAGFDKLTPELIGAIAGPTGAYAIARGISKIGNGKVTNDYQVAKKKTVGTTSSQGKVK